MLISVVSGYGRRVSGEADRERDLALDRLGRLADANALLYSLHRVAQTLPASLDMNDVLDSTVNRLRELIDFDSLVILLFDDTDGHWQVVRQEGCHLPARLGPTDLPGGMREAIAEANGRQPQRSGTARRAGIRRPLGLGRSTAHSAPAARSWASSPSSTATRTASTIAPAACSPASCPPLAHGARQRPLVRPAAHRRRR